MHDRELRELFGYAKEAAGGIRSIAASQASISRAAPPSGPARADVNVDALSSEEVAELELAIASGDAGKVARRAMSTPELSGMYEELSQLGLVEAFRGPDGEMYAIYVTSMGSWAVEKRRQRDAEAAAEREHQWRHDRKMTWVAALSGVLGAVVGSLLTVALEYWLLPK